MRAAHGDHHADLAQVEVADAVDQRELDDRPAAAGLGLELGQLLQGHLGVRFIVEDSRPAVAGQLADRPQERADRPRAVRSHPFGQRPRGRSGLR